MSDKITDIKSKKKLYLKRICMVLLILLVVLSAVYFVTKHLNDKVVDSESFVEQIEEAYPTYTPFPAEWNVDLSKDAEYLSLNTKIMYGEGETGSVYSLEDFYTTKDAGQKFFEEYFRILKEGDYESYPGLFTDKYKKVDSSKRFEKYIEKQFPPQRVHDITVRKLFSMSGSYEGKPCINGIYIVDYKINRNNNLFRNDIGWNAEYEVETSRPLYFELVTLNPDTDKEQTYIRNMYTESSMKAHANRVSGVEE